MKTAAVLFLGFFLAVSCSKDEPYNVEKVQTDIPSPGPVAGLWAGDLDFDGMGISIHLSFFMLIKDSAAYYLLYVEDRIHAPALDTIYWHTGKWALDADKDTTLFYGDTCKKDDSSKVLAPYTCEDSIAVGVNIDSTGAGCEKGCWQIRVQDMEQVILALGVSDQQYQMVKNVSILMTKSY